MMFYFIYHNIFIHNINTFLQLIHNINLVLKKIYGKQKSTKKQDILKEFIRECIGIGWILNDDVKGDTDTYINNYIKNEHT